MLSKIAGFEVRYQLFSPMFIAVFILFFLMFFTVISTDGNQLLRDGTTNINAPIVVSMIMILSSLFGGFIPAVFLSSGVLRDRTFKSEEIFFTRPVKETEFVLGRFLGGFIATILCFASVPLAILIGSQMPWLDQELIGPTRLEFFAYDFVVLGLVNMWVVGTVLFTVANFTRSMMVVWAAFLGLIILYIVTKIIANSDPAMRDLMTYLDPFGSTAHREISRYWTAFEQNSQIVPLQGNYLWNRIIWFGVGLAFLTVNVFTFRFRKSNSKEGSKPRKTLNHVVPNAAIADIVLQRMKPQLGSKTSLQQFFSRLNFEVKGVVFNFAFWVILVLGLLNTVPGFFFGNGLAGTANYPVTRVLMDVITQSFSIVPFVVIAFYAAELMWRERSVGFSDIVDATPTPNWVFLSAKFFAMCLVIAALALVAIASAVLTQSAMGYSVFEFDQYAIRGIVELFLPYVLLAVLAIFLQVLLNNRWLGMAAMLAYYAISQVMALVGFDHFLYRFGQAPASPYSDMNGYGHFLGINMWFNLYWGFWALLLVVVSYQLWNRGALTSIWKRLRAMAGNFTPATSGLTAVALIGAGLTGSWIFYNTNMLNTYVSGPELRAIQAEYERTYRHLVDLPQPTLIDTSYEVDIYPDERRYEVRGAYILENQTDAALDTLWVSYGAGTVIHSQIVEGANIASVDDRLKTFSFTFDAPLLPGERRQFDFEIARLNEGFRNSSNVSSVNANGSFFNNAESMPNIGANEAAFLINPEARRRQGLDPLPRAYALEDESHWGDNAFAVAHYVNFRTIVSTSADQIAIAPGYLEREWIEGDRAYFEYVMDRPILNFYAWQSARYEVLEHASDGIDYQIFYHPPHVTNVERILEASVDALSYFSENFSPYQYRQFRVQEFPSYEVFAQGFPNTVPFSEGIGFIADLRDPQGIDYVYFVTAHEAAHQWWAHQVTPANVQGAQMLSETFAEYSALMLLRREYGEEHMRRYLMRELDQYLDARSAETVEEQPLYRVEDQQYLHYRKGAVIMYALQDYLGEATVNRVLQRLIEERAYQTAPYATTLDFLRLLREEAGPEHEQIIHDFFERIVLFDLEVTEATATERDDGRWDVVIDIEAHKYEANGAGEQTEEAIDYRIDIGVFSADPDGEISGADHVLYLEKRRINAQTMRFELVVDEEPVFVGIDPYIKLIDRNSADNLAPVTIN
jgi:ABC-2 type transport system permease protein